MYYLHPLSILQKTQELIKTCLFMNAILEGTVNPGELKVQEVQLTFSIYKNYSKMRSSCNALKISTLAKKNKRSDIILK